MKRSIYTAFFALLGVAACWRPSARPPRCRRRLGQEIPRRRHHRRHPFNEPEFFKLFQGYDDITYKSLPQATGGEVFDDITDWPYDVIVLYNFNQKITPKQQENFVKLLEKGVGLVILHHANAAYNNWPLFWKIAGVEYHFQPRVENGVPMGTPDSRAA